MCASACVYLWICVCVGHSCLFHHICPGHYFPSTSSSSRKPRKTSRINFHNSRQLQPSSHSLTATSTDRRIMRATPDVRRRRGEEYLPCGKYGDLYLISLKKVFSFHFLLPLLSWVCDPSLIISTGKSIDLCGRWTRGFFPITKKMLHILAYSSGVISSINKI